MDGSLELRLPKKQTAVGGKDYLLTCYFIAMGVPEVGRLGFIVCLFCEFYGPIKLAWFGLGILIRDY